MKIDTGFAGEVVSKAIQKGADLAEVFVRASRNLSLEIKDQAVDSLESSLSFGYSLRIIRDGRLGFSYSNDRQEQDSVIGRALESSRYPDRDVYLDLPGAGGSAEVEVFDPAIRDLGEDEAIRKITLLERSVYAEDARIKKVRKASGSFTVSETAIVNSRSVSAHYASTSCSAQVSAIAEEGGESQIGWDYRGSRFLRDISVEDIGRKASRRALQLLGSGKIAGTRADVVLDNSVTVDFLGIFAASLSSEAVQKGKSLLAGKLGRKVVSPKIKMTDSGLLPGKLGSSPVDAEGVPAREKVLIRGGVLEAYIYNTYTAKKAGTSSTGNAVRGGFASLPSVGVTNFFLEAASVADKVSQNDILKSVERGLYVVDAMGVHTANPVSGEFSIGVTGLWIEHGEVKYPVKEAVISGNILDFFSRIEAVGDDLAFYDNIGGPCLVISGVDISG